MTTFGRRCGPLAVLLVLLAGCGTSNTGATITPPSTSTTAPTSDATPTSDPYALADPTDITFITQLRGKGLIPAVASPTLPDAAYVTDATTVCQLLATPGETLVVKATDLVNERDSTITTYNITKAQATDVIVMSAQTYCPDQVAMVKLALT